MPTPRNARAERKAADESNAIAFFGSRTEVGHIREHNEDSLVAVPPLFAVADGMGGHEAGEVASEIAINTIMELAPDHADSDALARAVIAANLNVIKAPAKGIGREGMGTTLTAAILEGERLIIAQVGDSRAYLLHEGKLQQLTRDHSLMADMIEAGQLTEAEARVHPNRSVITRAIGSDPHMQPDIYELNVETGDRILLCSDGICTMIEDPQIEHVMGHSRTAQECADNLVAAALEAGGFDNATAVVVDVEGFREVRERKAQRKSKILYTFLVLAVIAIFAYREAICSASIPTSWNPSCASAWGSRPCSPPVSANARPGLCSWRRRPRASGRLYGSSVSRADSFWRRPGARRISPSFWKLCASVCRTCSTCQPCAR